MFLLCTSICLAESKFEVGLFFGSYQPSFLNDEFYGLKLNGSKIEGYTFSYRIVPDFNIRVQMGFSEYKSQSPGPEIDIKLKTTIVSLLGVFDLFQRQNYKLYGGMGMVDYRITSNEPIFDNPPSSKHDFSFPWGLVFMLGVEAPLNKSCQLKGEIQYTARADGELFFVPLDCDGFKFLLSIGIKF